MPPPAADQLASSGLYAVVALQPNLLNDNSHLPLHYDIPRQDGFGVVIATIVMAGGGHIIIVDPEDDVPKSFSFPAEEGDIYLLSGRVRNMCLHGVFASCAERESLNLRFGMHTAAFARSEVEDHWASDDEDEPAAAGDDSDQSKTQYHEK